MEIIEEITNVIILIVGIIITILVFNEYAKTKQKDIEVKQSIIEYYRRKKWK